MKKGLFVLALGVAAVSTLTLARSAQACFRTQPVVSTDWLAEHADRPDLVLVDVRANAEYLTGHIPGSISIPFAMPESAWSVKKGDLLLEVPSEAQLSATLGAAGIDKHAFVVVINNTEVAGVPASHPRVQTARVAITLLYAGVRDVAILDGGIKKWAQEGRALSTASVTPAPVSYDPRLNRRMFVTKDYVASSMGKPWSMLLDVRDPEVYSGAVVEPYAPRPGHIPGAKNLPAPLIWNDDGTFKTKDELRALAVPVIGLDRGKEIIVYCSVGGYAAGWWFILTEMLGYRNVKFYDGSAQEWVADPNAPLETN